VPGLSIHFFFPISIVYSQMRWFVDCVCVPVVWVHRVKSLSVPERGNGVGSCGSLFPIFIYLFKLSKKRAESRSLA
jgi:hypothetical protein